MGRSTAPAINITRAFTMNGTITYRFDKDFGIPEWLELFEASHYNHWWTVRNARAALDYAHLVITAWDGAVAVGTRTVWSDGANFALIDDVVVHPHYRGRGIGTSLMRRALGRLEPLGLPFVQLLPVPGRESFFARLGFAVQPDAKVMDLATQAKSE